jgi:hypothetical protein
VKGDFIDAKAIEVKPRGSDRLDGLIDQIIVWNVGVQGRSQFVQVATEVHYFPKATVMSIGSPKLPDVM